MKILVVDDDKLMADEMAGRVEELGHRAAVEYELGKALRRVRRERFDFYILDINIFIPDRYRNMPRPGRFGGYILWRAIRDQDPEVPIAMHTGYLSSAEAAIDDGFTHFLTKPTTSDQLERLLRSLSEGLSALNVFVVHGRNAEALAGLEAYLSSIGIERPLILQRDLGTNKSIIEKFEMTALQSDACVVLVTADDIGRYKSDTHERPRPRQNVIFELGYFLGRLKRSTGRVITFVMGDVELPSDLDGVDFVRVESFDNLNPDLDRQIRSRFLVRR